MILIIMVLPDPASDQRPGECGKRLDHSLTASKALSSIAKALSFDRRRQPRAEDTLGLDCRCSIGPQDAERAVKDRGHASLYEVLACRDYRRGFTFTFTFLEESWWRRRSRVYRRVFHLNKQRQRLR
jgi:hypothetical protein